jgi:hypothetical protein
MVYFQTKNHNLGKFCIVLQSTMLVNFIAIWSILLLFCIFYGHLVYFTAVLYILWPFGILYSRFVYFMSIWYIGHFGTVLVYCTKKNLATLMYSTTTMA